MASEKITAPGATVESYAAEHKDRADSDDFAAANLARKAEVSTAGLDVGLAAIQAAGHVQGYSVAESRAIARRIDWFLLPLLMVTYCLQFIDKGVIAYASLFGMNKEIGLVGAEYSWLTTIFYIGYLLGQFPVNFLFQKLHITRSIGVLMFLWGAVLCGMSAANSFAGLMVARFFLGVLESGVSPCFLILTSMYYTREEQPLRTAVWISMIGFAQILAGPLALGISAIRNSLSVWRWSFLLFGIITVVWAFVFYFFTPPNPTKARWLSAEQKTIAIERVAANKTGMDTTEFKWYQVREALLDLKVWVLIIFAIAANIPSGGISAFGPLIIAGFGFSVTNTALLGMPNGVTMILALCITGVLAGRLKNWRIFLMIGGLLVAILGTVLMFALPPTNLVGKMIGYYLTPGFTATFTLTFGLLQANIAGRTKKTVVNSMFFIAYCVGCLIGPQLFFDSEAPTYRSSFISLLICFGVQIVLAVLLYIMYRADNRKRDILQQGSEELTFEELMTIGLSDMTDKENIHFRYAL